MKNYCKQLCLAALTLMQVSAYCQGTIEYLYPNGNHVVGTPFLRRGTGLSVTISKADRSHYTYALVTKGISDDDSKFVVVDTSQFLPPDVQSIPDVKSSVADVSSDKELANKLIPMSNNMQIPAEARQKIKAYLLTQKLITDQGVASEDPKLTLNTGGLNADSIVGVRVTPNTSGATGQVLQEQSVNVARMATTHAAFGTGLYWTSGTRAYKYSFQNTQQNTTAGGAPPAQGQSNYLFERTQIGNSVDANISGTGYYIFDEEQDPFKALTHTPGRWGLMLGINASTSDLGSAPVYLVGVSYFLDRELNGSLSIGLAFRQGQSLLTGNTKTLGNVYADNEVFTENKWYGSLFIGLNFSVAK